MHSLLKFFSLLQLTKDQPLTGYLIGGFTRAEIPSLADHHYTATMMGWLLTEEIQRAGGQISQRRVILMLLIHDLPELFGGDIATPLNRKYPDLREYKNKIGERAMQMLSDIIGGGLRDELHALWNELEQEKTDEAILVKIIDQMDHHFFMEHRNCGQSRNARQFAFRKIILQKHVYAAAGKIKDHGTKDFIKNFLQTFDALYLDRGYQALQILMGSDAPEPTAQKSP